MHQKPGTDQANSFLPGARLRRRAGRVGRVRLALLSLWCVAILTLAAILAHCLETKGLRDWVGGNEFEPWDESWQWDMSNRPDQDDIARFYLRGENEESALIEKEGAECNELLIACDAETGGRVTLRGKSDHRYRLTCSKTAFSYGPANPQGRLVLAIDDNLDLDCTDVLIDRFAHFRAQDKALLRASCADVSEGGVLEIRSGGIAKVNHLTLGEGHANWQTEAGVRGSGSLLQVTDLTVESTQETHPQAAWNSPAIPTPRSKRVGDSRLGLW